MNYQGPPPVYRNPGLAAVLSFFYMGLGQIYNGQIAKGIAFIIFYSISWVLWLVIIGIFITPILWVWGMIDAYKSAEKLNYETAWRTGASEPPAGSGRPHQEPPREEPPSSPSPPPTDT